MAIKDAIEKFVGAKWKTMSDYENEAAAKKAPKTVVKKTEIIAVPEDDMPATDEKGKYLKPTVPTTMKKGGKVKCMARGGGIEVRGKTKGRFV